VASADAHNGLFAHLAGAAAARITEELGAMSQQAYRRRAAKPRLRTLRRVRGPITPRVVANVLGPFARDRVEGFFVIAVDEDLRWLGGCEIARGDRNGVEVEHDELVAYARSRGARAVYLGHNHTTDPDDEPEARPSGPDIILTRDLRVDLHKAGIALADHIIVARGIAWSVRQRRLL
jgi:DNA repair protein RadC